jgi:hypothetical protein
MVKADIRNQPGDKSDELWCGYDHHRAAVTMPEKITASI